MAPLAQGDVLGGRVGEGGAEEEVLTKETEKRAERKVSDGQTPALPLSFLCCPTEG